MSSPSQDTEQMFSSVFVASYPSQTPLELTVPGGNVGSNDNGVGKQTDDPKDMETGGNVGTGNNSEAAAAQIGASIPAQAAMRSANGGSQTPATSVFTGAAALEAITMVEKLTEKDGGQSGNLDMTLDNPLQDIFEQFRRWYQPGSEIEQAIVARASLSITCYMHTVRVQALNFALPERSITVDENSTLVQIGLLLHNSEGKAVPVALEQTCGPFPKWSIPDINSKIKGGIQKVYAADITKPFTLALVRDVGEDFPLLIPLESLKDSTKTIGNLVGSLLPGRAKQGLSIRLFSSPEEIRTMPCDRIQEHIKEPYSTTILVLLTSGPEVYKFRYDYDGPSVPALKVAFLRCLGLIDVAGKQETFPLQAIYLSQSLLHLIVCLAEVDRSKMEASLKAYYVSRMNILVVKLRTILANEPSVSTSQSLQEFYEEICEEQPGVVAVRQSFKSFQALASLDREERGTSSKSLDTNTAAPRAVSHQDSRLLRDENPRMAPEEIESSSSESSGHAHSV